MRTSLHHIWGSASGPVKTLRPHTRIVCGVFIFATCLIAPATCWPGIAAVMLAVVLWAAVVRPPGRIIRQTLYLGFALFLPYFLLVPLIHDASAGRDWIDALGVSWRVCFRGMTTMQVSVYTASALSASALREGLYRLPLPQLVSAVLIQIIQQTANLFYETRQIASAVAVRGATTRYRTGLKVLASLPRVWLPRVINRAERAAAAMELRGYCALAIESASLSPSRLRDFSAITSAALVMIGVSVLRIWGGC